MQLRQVRMAVKRAKEVGISCEVIDLRTILPWDQDTVVKSIKKTGRCIVTHEAPITCGFGAELSARV
jgi:2-oxoisovalerate dehydrogenase E1 component beta subunit